MDGEHRVGLARDPNVGHTLHEAVIRMLLSRHPRAQRHRFLAAFWEGIRPDLCELTEVERSDLPRIIPDAYEIRADDGVAVIYEVEDTSALKPQKLCRYAHLAYIAEMAGWTIEMVIVDRYGRETLTRCGPLYTALIGGGYTPEYDIDPAMVAAIF